MSEARTVLLLAVAAASCLPLSGCLAPPMVVASAGLGALQTGTTAFIRGELEYADAVPMEYVYQASLDSVRDLQFPLVSHRMGANEASVIAKESGGRSIKIHLERKSPIATKVNIRIGVWGDQAISRLVQQTIQKHLPTDFIPPPTSEQPEMPPRKRDPDFPQ